MATKRLFDFSVDVMRAILWQYNDAAKLQSILEAKQAWYNLNFRDFWADWYTNVFNLQTCNDFGLTVWAIILDMPIVVQIEPATPSRPTWGYEEFHRNFDRGNFFDGKGGAQVLTPADARIALRMRYFQLTGRGTVPEINRLLKSLFGDRGLSYVEDNNDMTISYKFGFYPTAQLLLTIVNNDLLPRPSGVGVDYAVNVDFVFDGTEQVYEGLEAVIV